MKIAPVKSLKAGFSLVEMLVVIAIIGIIAAIAIPNIGSINESARDATAKRNAQSAASVLNAAAAAGVDFTASPYSWTDSTPAATILNWAEGASENDSGETATVDVKPGDGAFEGKTFTTGNIDKDEEAKAASYLSFDADNNRVVYNPGA
jgi:type IV pilus assembly protein PilA